MYSGRAAMLTAWSPMRLRSRIVRRSLGDLVHQVSNPPARGAGLDEVPDDGAGGALAEPIDLVVALVDCEAGLKSSSA